MSKKWSFEVTLIAFPVACHELKNLEKTHKKYKAMFRRILQTCNRNLSLYFSVSLKLKGNNVTSISIFDDAGISPL